MEENLKTMGDHIAQSYKNEFENSNGMGSFLGIWFYKIDPSREKMLKQISKQILNNILKDYP